MTASESTVFVCPGCGKKTTEYDKEVAYCSRKGRGCPIISFKKTRLEGKIIQRTKGDIYNANWMHSDFLEWWLKQFVSHGTCLNVCCGYSTVGDVRVDISPDSTRTVAGDLKGILKQFGPNSFDSVYIDPRYEDYTSGENRNLWQLDAMQVARKVLITKRPRVNVNLPSSKHYYAVVEEGGSPALSLLRFDIKNQSLIPNA